MASITVLILAMLASVATSQFTGDNVQYRPDTCLQGDKHIELPRPEPENSSYRACHQWKDGACCTPEFTVQLANSNVTNIDGFHWNRCGDVSQQCRRFFIEIECFYRCSPNIAHFAFTQFQSALRNLPICSDYCDRWYDACKDELTCVEDWISGWTYLPNGINVCPENSTCRPYSEWYQDGRGICNRLWGQSFFYSNYTSSDNDRQCLVPYFNPNETNPNNIIIQRFLNSGGNTQLKAAAIFIVLAGIMALLI